MGAKSGSYKILLMEQAVVAGKEVELYFTKRFLAGNTISRAAENMVDTVKSDSDDTEHKSLPPSKTVVISFSETRSKIENVWADLSVMT